MSSEQQLTVFYCMYEEQQCVKPSEQFQPKGKDIPHLAEVVLADTKGSFIGFIDASDATLQFIIIGPDKVGVDMPDVASNGSFVKKMTIDQALEIIGSISAPLARYQSELGLEFKKW